MSAFPLRAAGALLLALALPLVVRAEPDDADFARKAASGGMLEVQLGAYAAKNAADADVRAFGERMVRDHSQANDQLRAAAQEAGISLPSTMNDEHRATFEQLTGLQGEAFDDRYVQVMLDDHASDVADFQQQAEGGDSRIDRWAKQTLPTLESHLAEARKLVRSEVGEPPANRQ